jgi:type I restriction enzyme S subunit
MSTATTHIETDKQLVPALRFKEFDGEWDKEVLQGTCKKPISYGIVQTGEDQEDGIPCVRVVDLTNKDTKRSNMICTTPQISESYSKTILEENELMLALRGEIGLVKMVTKELIGANLTRGVARLSTYENKYSSAYIMWLLQSENVIKDINKRVNGSALKEIPLSGLRKVKLTYPSLPEQQKIASFLSAVDEKIQQLTKKKALLEQYKKGVMQQLFSGQLRFKDENGKDYPDWEEKRLGKVCEVNPKNGELPSSFVYIDLESVEKGQLIKENRIDLIDAPSRAQRNLAADDILYQTVRPYQKNNLFFNKMGEYVASTGYAQLRAKESAMYIFQLMHHDGFVNKVLVRCTGTSYPAINSTDLAKINVSIPSMEEQKKIATYLSRIDTKIEAVNNQITQTQTFKKGLLQQMVV